jgi:diadenosine tetraphosphate (Ap4A) HIT family hydrolase
MFETDVSNPFEGVAVMNATITRFGYPESLLHEYRSWVVLLRSVQPTLGSLVLACTEDATSLGMVSSAAYAELATATADLEHALGMVFSYQKINYLALMMVDPHVHFHVLPRYAQEKAFEGATYRDAAFPKPPDLSVALALTTAQMGALHATLRAAWPKH